MAFAPPFQRPFSATFDRRAAVVGNGLLNNLIAYWPCDEASGDLLDAHSNGLTLTQNGSPGSGTGKIGTARVLNGTNNYFKRTDDTYLSTGDVDFTITAWVYPTELRNGAIVAKYTTNENKREYLLFYNTDDHVPNNVFSFVVSANGTTFVWVDASAFGAAMINNWYHVCAWHDASNNQIGISINDGTPATTAHSAGVADLNADFDVGIVMTTEPVYYYKGRIDGVGFWKSAAGGGGVLTAAQRTALWNAGNGLAYSQFTT